MSVESWARRASGLLVPTLGFAHKLGRFQPCVGPCCGEEPVTCSVCPEGTAPAALEITIAGVTNNDCSNCGDISAASHVIPATPAWNDGYRKCTYSGEIVNLGCTDTTLCRVVRVYLVDNSDRLVVLVCLGTQAALEVEFAPEDSYASWWRTWIDGFPVDCKDFDFTTDMYWFPGISGSSCNWPLTVDVLAI